MSKVQHTAGDRTPFTYVIKCLTTNQIYYGVRYAEKCHPTDLGTKYFSSSTVMKRRLKAYGSSMFEFNVRKIFNSIDAAKTWELKVLRRINAKDHPSFVNRQNHLYPVDNRGSKNPMYGLPGTMLGKQSWCKGLTKYTDERLAKHAKSCSIAQKGRQRVEQFSLLKGEKHLRFEGWYHTPWGKFATTREAANHGLQHTNIRDICKVNPDSVVSNRTKNTYLKQFHGKTFREIGFWFEPISSV